MKVGMKKVFKILCFVFVGSSAVFAQDYVAPLTYNTSLYYKTAPYRNVEKGNFQSGNLILTSDTLSIPFVDDFSKNTLRPFDFDINITDSLEYCSGECFDDNEMHFHLSQGYTYSFNLGTMQVDSVPTTPVTIYDFIGDCTTPASSFSAWLPYYHQYTFDSTTGMALDSVLSNISVPDTVIRTAKVYLGTLPGSVNWMDNYAYYNTTYPILPPTIGVATLDGLNEFGQPYNNSNAGNYGKADVLTSKPIDLSGLVNNDSVFLSFFYQAKGLGDFPNFEDSLIVQFKQDPFFALPGEDWITVWSTSGFCFKQ